MSILRAVSIDDISARGSIKDTDVQRLRQAYHEDGVISREEAAALFQLNDACPVQDACWSDSFIELLVEHVVHQSAPEGYVTAEKADWLITKIAPKGRIESKIKLELLISVIDHSRWTPERLVCLALEQVRLAVVEGNGPLRDGRSLVPGAVSDGEVELLRRILYAFGGDGSVAISRAEAEILCAIDAATSSGDNAAGWRDLYVKAMSNCALAASGYAVPTREMALTQAMTVERARDDRSARLADRIPADEVLAEVPVASEGPTRAGLLARYRYQSNEEKALARLERQRVEIITGDRVSEVEPQWLAERIGRNGQMTPNETALIGFLRAERPALNPVLQILVERTARAA